MNKNMLKIAGIIGYVSAGLYLITLMSVLIFAIQAFNIGLPHITLIEESELEEFLITMSIIVMLLLVPLSISTFIGARKLYGYSALDGEELKLKRNSVTAWSVFFILTNIIIGIFGFLALSQGNNSSSNDKTSLESRLKELQNLYDKGLISSEEYHLRRKIMIEKI